MVTEVSINKIKKITMACMLLAVYIKPYLSIE